MVSWVEAELLLVVQVVGLTVVAPEVENETPGNSCPACPSGKLVTPMVPISYCDTP